LRGTFDDSHECLFDIIAVEGRCFEVEKLIIMCKVNNLLQFDAPFLLLVALVA
jgi:hypothetical protein